MPSQQTLALSLLAVAVMVGVLGLLISALQRDMERLHPWMLIAALLSLLAMWLLAG